MQEKNLKRQHEHIISLEKKSRSTQSLANISKKKQPDIAQINSSFEKLRENY